ncbi:MAG: hypothetical protein JJE04_12560 [Acidobacteriia bacterium]|nr:hypothetical protein [Terriglobia bacterium]
MTEVAVTLDELLAAREDLIAGIVGNMPRDHRRFLVSIKAGEPDWALLDVPGAEALPAVRWGIDQPEQNETRLAHRQAERGAWDLKTSCRRLQKT